ncbi:cell division protein ZipA [Thorsellia anophelis]|uniref:Cell division protein ZipA n=1 Tax=Thorsellia anophelis DSM 18579 TaxID=1123402 RepID=A0A1I0DEL5_9GAMM|nr:cell division protein ZipA [Thorsellia anophelis]SET30812.1 cell division protein ZipA [Thorsellia anophelis DSM 18579]
MKDNLRLILLVVGVIAIAALLIHGIWSSRKERSSLFGSDSKTKNRERHLRRDELDDEIDTITDNFHVDNHELEESVSPVITKNKNSRNKKFHDKQPEFSFDENDLSKQQILNDNTDKDNEQVTEDLSHSEHTVISSLKSDSISIEQNDVNTGKGGVESELKSSTLADNKPETEEEIETPVSPVPDIPQLVIVFHIIGINDQPLRGDLLLNSFLNSGLHFGKMSIFHRHLSSADTPVLFSVANMVKPGIFEPNNMIDFTTPGITCFMVLPTAGQPLQNFKLMLQTVQRIADDVGANVYDENRRLLTPQKIEDHRLSIRKWVEENS